MQKGERGSGGAVADRRYRLRVFGAFRKFSEGHYFGKGRKSVLSPESTVHSQNGSRVEGRVSRVGNGGGRPARAGHATWGRDGAGLFPAIPRFSLVFPAFPRFSPVFPAYGKKWRDQSGWGRAAFSRHGGIRRAMGSGGENQSTVHSPQSGTGARGATRPTIRAGFIFQISDFKGERHRNVPVMSCYIPISPDKSCYVPIMKNILRAEGETAVSECVQVRRTAFSIADCRLPIGGVLELFGDFRKVLEGFGVRRGTRVEDEDEEDADLPLTFHLSPLSWAVGWRRSFVAKAPDTRRRRPGQRLYV
jgi:hypothetical protein